MKGASRRPIQFHDMAAIIHIDDMLSALRLKRIPTWLGINGCGGTDSARQITMMPAAAIPPQFLDVIIGAQVVNVPSAGEHVSGRRRTECS